MVHFKIVSIDGRMFGFELGTADGIKLEIIESTDIGLMQLRESLLQSTSMSVLDKLLDNNKVLEMCCLGFVSLIRLKGQIMNPMIQ